MKVLVHNSCLLAVIWQVLWVCSATAQTVVLPSAAYVMGDAVRLSDLLPRGASDELRHASQGIELGLAPQLGSMRVYDSSRILQILNAHPEIAKRIVVPDQVVVRRSGFPLSSEAIYHAVTSFLREKGEVGDVPESALRRAGDITTAEANPALEVRAVNWDPGRRLLQFCLRCVKSAACHDFLVYLTPQGILARQLGRLGWSTNLATKTHTATEETADSPILIEAGRKARLLMQGDGIQISVQVICLERGRAGQKIRVRETGSPQIFRAQVVSRDLLWSRLES